MPKKAPPQLVTGPVQGVLPTIAETTVPVGERDFGNYDAAKRLAQQGAGRNGQTSPAALPAYDAGRPPVQNAALVKEMPAEPEITGSIAARPKADEGWFSSTASSFRGVASAVGLW
jgi:hypothetical protein